MCAHRLNYSRRGFLALAGAGLYSIGRAATAFEGLTARQVIERIQKNVGVPWRSETVDTFKIGNPDTVVKGIATSFSATLDVCQRAHAAGKNLIIAHEPTFYNHTDDTTNLSGEIYEAKRNFIEKNGLVVWRFHDHWHARKPDGILAGMTEALGWGKYQSSEQPRRFSLPGATLEALAKSMQDRPLAYFVSRENIDKEGRYKTGFTIQAMRPPQPRSGEDLAKAMIAGAELKKQLVRSWKTTKGVFDSYGLEFKNLESNNEVTISHVLIITNTRTRTFYFCLFESVESKWKEAWKIGEQIVQTLILNDDI